MSVFETWVRRGALLLCELLTLGVIVFLLFGLRWNRLPLAVFTLVLLFLPLGVERILRCKISLPVYLFFLFYAIGPMLGYCCNLYYILPGWDKLLHFSGGVVFALFGCFLFERFFGKQDRSILCLVLFAFCFSVTLSVLWEFAEFGCDRFFGTDMQHDTTVTTVHSYLLSDAVGEIGSLENIGEVSVDGKPLPFRGYLDLGLIDTMWDMLVETVGAFAVAMLCLIDRGRHPVFRIHGDGES